MLELGGTIEISSQIRREYYYISKVQMHLNIQNFMQCPSKPLCSGPSRVQIPQHQVADVDLQKDRKLKLHTPKC